MEVTTVIRKPLVTEKTTGGMEENRYAFEVDRRATKLDIKYAVQELYKVRVLSVATSRFRKGGIRRTRYGYVKPRIIKKAIVKVHPDDRIDLF